MQELTQIQSEVIRIYNLNLNKKSSKGWILTEKACPVCGKDDYHMGIKLNEDRSGKYKNHVIFNCFKCRATGTEFKLLKGMGFDDLLSQKNFIKTNRVTVESKIYRGRGKVKEEPIDLSTEVKHPPLGFREKKSDPYLDKRGFESWQYDQYTVGRTRIGKLRDYVVFLVKEDGKNRGYVARHVWDKEKIKSYEQRSGKKLARYINESGVDFDSLLFGIDEIEVGKTKTAILVEGVFDKTNVDKQLELNTQDEIKCLCTFGKSLSPIQVAKLKAKGIENIIIMYDSDAINESKEYGFMIVNSFKNVRNCFISINSDRDPGDFDFDEIMDLIENAESPFKFSMSKVQKRKLLK